MKKKIYFIHQALSSFVKKDLEILEEYYEVRIDNNYNFNLKKILSNLFGAIWSDIIFCWFGSPKFLFPVFIGRIIGKKIVIIAGGYDVADVSEIGYGNLQGGITAFIQKKIFKLSDKIICISKSNMKEAIQNAKISPEKIELIYHGFNVPEESESHKENIVITIGRVNEENLLRKGHKYFIEVAQLFPNVKFYLIGSINSRLKKRLCQSSPSNLTITGYLNDESLKAFFKRAKVYVQASLHEGFGCSVAEAMKFKCIPVVSDCYALPEVVGDSGYIFRCKDTKNMKENISLALKDDGKMGKMARKRVENLFALEARRNKLIKLIDSL